MESRKTEGKTEGKTAGKTAGLVGWREAADASLGNEFYPTLLQAVSQCRGCQFFAPIGRRGGECLRLAAPVAGIWTACALAEPIFAPAVAAGHTPPWALSPELGRSAIEESIDKSIDKHGEKIEAAGVRTTGRSRVD